MDQKLEIAQPKRIVVNENDTDGDGVPDYADGFGLGGLDKTKAGIDRKRFTPLVIQVPADVPLAKMQLTVSYAASDPRLVGADFVRPASGSVRIWTRNASELRSPGAVTAGGDFVADGVVEDLSHLGFTEAKREVTLYVEGVATTHGESTTIGIQLHVSGRLIAKDLVTVLVVPNTLVIGIDGTGQDGWLGGENAKRPNGLWNSHVRNLIDDVWRLSMTDYSIGVTWDASGIDADNIESTFRGRAEDIITDAGGGTRIAIIGWSRGGMIAFGMANALCMSSRANLYPRTVAYVGSYDPVDMSSAIPAAWNVVDARVEAVTIVGPRNPAQFPVGTYENIDYPVTYRYVFQSYRREAYYDKDKDGNWTVPRIRHTGNEPTRTFYNASHGAIGGTPGFSGQHTNDGPYDYALDVENSFNADRDVRDGMRARPGFEFVPARLPEWYGFYPTDPEAQ